MGHEPRVDRPLDASLVQRTCLHCEVIWPSNLTPPGSSFKDHLCNAHAAWDEIIRGKICNDLPSYGSSHIFFQMVD